MTQAYNYIQEYLYTIPFGLKISPALQALSEFADQLECFGLISLMNAI